MTIGLTNDPSSIVYEWNDFCIFVPLQEKGVESGSERDLVRLNRGISPQSLIGVKDQYRIAKWGLGIFWFEYVSETN